MKIVSGLLVLGAAVALGLVAAVPHPKVSLECCATQGPNYYVGGPGYILIWATLTNQGDAAGRAVVNWLVNRVVVQQASYVVPSHGAFEIGLSRTWYGGVVESSYLELVLVQGV